MLPPNARKIKRARDVGQHPDEITLVYASRWPGRRYGPDAVIVLAPAYGTGEYDPFAWCAGIATTCINHDCDAPDFLRLVGDVASWTAPVLVLFDRGESEDASLVMHASRWPKRDQEWPDGWDTERDRAYAQRLRRYWYVQERRAEGRRA